MTPSADIATSPSSVLRERTADHHQNAERAPFQRALVSGQVALSTYLSWLGQMYWVFQALERTSIPPGPAGPIQHRTWARTDQLLADCSFFDVDPRTIAPTAATSRFVSQIDAWAAECPASILGVLYVLEGSTNGGKFISKAVRRSLRLPDHRGTTFLDPHGDDQRARWQLFKLDLDRSIPPHLIDRAVEAAQATFDAATSIGGSVIGVAAPANPG